MYTISVNSNVELLCKEVAKIDTPKIASKKTTFVSLNLRISKTILQIVEVKVSKFTFRHTLSESKSIFAVEQKAIVSCFVKECCVFIGTLEVPLRLQQK